MPTQTQYRLWCKSCEEFQLFSKEFQEVGKQNPLKCTECENIPLEGDFKLSEIPEEKILEQRKRYYDQEGANIVQMLQMMGGNPNMRKGLFEGFHKEVGEIEIIETDAGQKLVDEAKKKERDKRAFEAQLQRRKDLEWKQTYHKLGRNDLCICDSGKKYKRCCWNKVQKIP